MEPQSEHPVAVHRRRELPPSIVNDRKLHRLVEQGAFVRVAAGSYVAAKAWNTLTPLNKHLVRVFEVLDRTRAPQVITHDAAAAVWGIDRIGSWPTLVDIRIPRSSGGRSSGGIRRRALGFEGVELVEWRGHLITSPAQTALDLAAESSFKDGTIAIDQTLWRRRSGGPLAVRQHVCDLYAAQQRRGMARVGKMLDFATDLSDSVRESEGRVLLQRLGFPAPQLQKRFLLPNGREAFTDYYFAEYDHAAEFDGTGKYFDPDLLSGRTPEQALLEEKDRADALRRVVSALSRWRTPAHKNPQLLYDILIADGLPSRLPRPRKGAR